MSGAKWITAERKSWSWCPTWWSRWRAKRSAARTNIERHEEPQLVLVGTFDDLRAVARATAAFEAAAFTAEEFAYVAARAADAAGFWSKLSAWFCNSQLLEQSDAGAVSDVADTSGTASLASAAGIILVRSAVRFHQACRIIEEAGGRIGLNVPLELE